MTDLVFSGENLAVISVYQCFLSVQLHHL